MFQEVKSINAPLHRDPRPSSSQPPPAMPPSDHQKAARVPHTPTGAPPSLRFFFCFAFCFLVCIFFFFFRGIKLKLDSNLVEPSSSNETKLDSSLSLPNNLGSSLFTPLLLGTKFLFIIYFFFFVMQNFYLLLLIQNCPKNKVSQILHS
jgi:hypothetical protein